METRRFAGANGVTLTAHVGGSTADQVVLLLPGSGQTRHAWDDTAKALVAAGRYVVALDLRGHGDSDWANEGGYELNAFVEDLLAVLPQLPGPPAIIGSALGGTAALIAVGEAVAPIARALILVDVAPKVAPKGLDLVAELLSLDAEGFATVEVAADAMAVRWGHRSSPGLEDLRKHLRRSDDGLYRWHWDPAIAKTDMSRDKMALNEQRIKAAVSAISTPMLVIRGEHSELVDDASVESFRALNPATEFTTVEGVGHRMLGDRNDAFNGAIIEFLERRDPRPGGHAQGGIDGATMRSALGCFATGVTVITTCGTSGEPLGFTANSFTSVSLDPALVLFCIKREAASVAALRATSSFAVNVLHLGQESISNVFASRTADRFAETDWETWDTGVPIISDAMANFECSIDELFEGGDHFIVIGRVRRVLFNAARDPLLFLHGKYRRVHLPDV